MQCERDIALVQKTTLVLQATSKIGIGRIYASYCYILYFSKVSNLAYVHHNCLEAINNPNADTTGFDAKARKKIEGFRKKLALSHVKTTV